MSNKYRVLNHFRTQQYTFHNVLRSCTLVGETCMCVCDDNTSNAHAHSYVRS